MFLIKQLMNLRYREGAPVANHVNAFQGIINQLSSMGISFEDEVRVLLLLGSLPDTWETLKVTLCNSALLTLDFGTCQEGVLQRRKGSALYDRWI